MACKSPCFCADDLISSLRVVEISYREEALKLSKLPDRLPGYFKARAKAEAISEVLTVIYQIQLDAEQPRTGGFFNGITTAIKRMING